MADYIPKSITEFALQNVQNQDSILKALYDALSLLESSGVLPFLKARATIHLLSDTDNHNALATLAAWKGGYNECINDLIMFRERYMTIKPAQVPLRDYGGVQSALLRGELTKEEADVIRSGKLSELETKYKSSNKK